MTTTAAPILAEERRPEPATWTPAGRWLRFGLVLAAVAVALLVVAVGQRQQTWADLRAGVAAGEVHEVWVTPGISPGSRGSAVVLVQWHDGLLLDTTTVVERDSDRRFRGSGRFGADVTAVLPGTVEERLRRLDADIEVHRTEWPTSTAETAGFVLPGWTSWCLVGFAIATLLALRLLPPPTRATRWAWFWLMASSPIGLAAFLALGGPLPGTRGARSRQRLTGGWAFLLGIVLGAIAGW